MEVMSMIIILAVKIHAFKTRQSYLGRIGRETKRVEDNFFLGGNSLCWSSNFFVGAYY
ncbi:hypothetical protein GIB67_010087 [Kingdonia uniflora]|uniref:Uncharacterized protein n=1 Tax=Kingdonia uniflora TaxID=39325 RepID=A0A7J7PAU0_9MAGN|nr:hypothetical protein GIB67_010087 [Kingdonia uniflora]